MSPTDIAVACINGAFLVIVTLLGGDIRRRAISNHHTLKQVEKQTNGAMEAKIRKAVIEVFNERQKDVTEAVMAESLRHLLDAMIGARDDG